MSAKAHRAGTTEKISISIDVADLAVLRRRARKLYRGNLSAAVGEGVLHIREQEGREGLVRWLGKAGEATDAERARLRAEQQVEPVVGRKKSGRGR
jgi:hypothetical protein